MAKIIPLSEGTFTIGFDKIFIPFDPIHDNLAERKPGSLVVEIQPFVIQEGNEFTLFDTGLGYHLLNGELQIHHNLRSVGIDPLDIKTVVLSHLHKDHAGGISYVNKFGHRKLSFPNATYHVYQKEFDYAMAHPGASYLLEEFDFLKTSGNAHFYNEENGQINDYIQHFWSGGHCPQHQVLLYDNGKEKFFFGGDEAPQKSQMIMRFIAKYDADGKRAANLREEYAAKGKQENWMFMYYHDIQYPYGLL